METYTTIDNKKIYVFPNLLSKDICLNWIEKMKAYTTTIVVDQEFSTEIFETVKSLIPTLPISISTHRHEVTLSARGVYQLEHFDKVFSNEKWKVVCYLNEVENGGTDFKNGSEWLSINSHMGSVVIFDISLFHRGCPKQESKTKYTVGIRLIE